MHKKQGRSHHNQSHHNNQQSLHSKTGISQQSIEQASSFILGRASQHFPISNAHQQETKHILQEKNLGAFLNTIVKKLPPPNNKVDLKSALSKMKVIADNQEKTIQKNMANANKDFFDDDEDLENFELVENSQFDEPELLNENKNTNNNNYQSDSNKNTNDENQKQKSQQMQRTSLKRRLQHEKENIHYESHETSSLSTLNLQKTQSSTLPNRSNYFNNKTNQNQSNAPTLQKKKSSKLDDKKKQQQQLQQQNQQNNHHEQLINNITNNTMNQNNNFNLFQNEQTDFLSSPISSKNNRESALQTSDFCHHSNSGSLLQPQYNNNNTTTLDISPTKCTYIPGINNDYFLQHRDQVDGSKSTPHFTSNYINYDVNDKFEDNMESFFQNI